MSKVDKNVDDKVNGSEPMAESKTSEKTMETPVAPDNLAIYNRVRAVPAEAQKAIEGGRLKGKTDINPMWRIKTLTEQFGICGVGWKYEIIKQWTEQTAPDTVAAFVNINLYIRQGDEWSEAIPGTGGSKLLEMERNGLYTNDECFKMALTDALSVSCKALGIAADIYWDKDNTKYDDSKRKNDNSNNENDSGNNGDGGNTPPTDSKPTGKKASDKQVKLIYSIVNDISKGYEAIGQTALPDAIVKRMRETLKFDKNVNEFTTKDASAAIDYLSKIKLQIPKSKEAG